LRGRPAGLARSAAIAAGLAATVSGYGVGAARQRLAAARAMGGRPPGGSRSGP
jgi:hypothetical protein